MLFIHSAQSYPTLDVSILFLFVLLVSAYYCLHNSQLERTMENASNEDSCCGMPTVVDSLVVVSNLHQEYSQSETRQ